MAFRVQFDGNNEVGAFAKLKLNDLPCRIGSVNFEGVHRTRPSLIARIVTDIYNVKTVLEFVEKCVKINENLMSLNAFNDVEVKVNPKDEELDVTFILHERKFIAASVQTAVDDVSTHVNVSLGLPNLNGLCDSLSLSAKLNRRLYSGECRYSLPLAPWKKLWAPTYSLACSQFLWYSQPSKFDQEDKSIINKIDFFSLPNLKHSISFENVWRNIKSSGLGTPIEILEQCGHSLKSCLKHSVTWDNRVGGNYPYEGMMASLTNEFATNLVSGSAKFTRHELNLQANQLILPRYDILCQANLLAGTLIRPQRINICDKFFAGGPLTVRGFQLQGLGPNVRGHPLGDLSFLSFGLHVYSILPFTTPLSPINQYIRPHLFLNSGTIGDVRDIFRISSRDDLRRESIRFKDSLRYSAGLGLVMYFFNLRLEVNYCLPLKALQNDRLAGGLQWGFGLHYT